MTKVKIITGNANAHFDSFKDMEKSINNFLEQNNINVISIKITDLKNGYVLALIHYTEEK